MKYIQENILILTHASQTLGTIQLIHHHNLTTLDRCV